ncbi:tuftelin-interacting protein 11-like [Gigantopelta aegis]|uniref:tuftelin-interacting protein 11-like n=1 Tax=Gigantopelta aegis TaxID=1735272 RepID=UPI001B88C257|nr:tuftelin-interacting protein 11-like [Gigantopelta aegis]
MSSPEVERFEISENDIEDIYNPGQRRFRQTKNQATYGIWADKESDEEERPGFGGRSRRKDYSNPVSFVSGGFKEEDKLLLDDENDSASDSDVPPKANTSKPFLQGHTLKKTKHETPHYLKGHHEDREFGKWEKHTRGIGQLLLQKMGYKPGEGLGSKGQGITTPVEAYKRRGKGTIGFHGTERSDRSLKDFPVEDSEEDEEKEFQKQLQQWKRKPETKRQKPKYVYKTAKEVIDSGVGRKRKVQDTSTAKVKVIDMTGREKRVLSGYHAISHRHDKPDEEEVIVTDTRERKAFDMPELLHNLNLLVDMSEEDIIENDRRLKYERDLIVNMRYEKERLDTICRDEEQKMDKLKKVLDIVQSCEARTTPDCENPLTLDECVEVFKELQRDYYEEYKMYDMSALAIALVFPLMKRFFEKWQPFEDPSFGVNTMHEWRLLLDDQNYQFTMDLDNMDTFQRLIWDVWLPPVRVAILQWNVRNPDQVIRLLELWKNVLPSWVMENILNQLVLPTLLGDVEMWNPLTDTMPIHAWIHPWLPLMADKLSSCYGPIRHKLANALVNWHPSDASAKIILQPWVGVWKQGHMDAFLVRNIVPKLGLSMQEMIINPHQQILDPWRWFISWHGIVPNHHMVSILEKTFFPKWLQVLCGWLGNMPNYEEITKWYLGWKALFPEDLLIVPVVKDQFSKALDIMNRAVSGHFQPGARENIAYFTHTERRQMELQGTIPPPLPPQPTESLAGRTTGGTAVSSFKELVEKKAEENNILFMPVPGKTHEARQVHRFGNVQVYIDRSVIFMYNGNQWVPVSLQRLVECAKS